MNPLRSFLGQAKKRKSASKSPRTVFRPVLETMDERINPSHFRYANVSVAQTADPGDSALAMHFEMTQAWRTSAFTGANTVGNVIANVGTWNFGDGGNTPINLKVLSVNVAEDWFVGTAGTGSTPSTFVAGFDHTYANAVSNTAFMSSCCRIGGLLNNSNGDYRIETSFIPGSNQTPISSLAPIVQVADNTMVSFQIPAFDADNDAITFRFATSAEAGGFVQPTGLAISSTGLVTWNLLNSGGTATVPGNLWTAQLMMEDRDGGPTGTVKSKVPLDFVLQVVTATNQAPTVSANPAGPFLPVAGQTINFTVTGQDSDGTITALQALNPPAGMTFGPLVISGNQASRTVSWTPTQAQSGQTFVITFQTTDNQGANGQTSVTISPSVNLAPSAVTTGPYDVDEGGSVQLSGSGSDPEGLPVTYSWDLDYNGSFETSGQNPIFSAAGLDGGLGTHQHVVFRVTDAFGNNTDVETEIHIENVAPTFEAGPTANLPPASGTLSRTGIAFTDPGVPDVWSGTVDYGDGSGVQTLTVDQLGITFDLGHVYTASGTYTVTVVLNDDDGGSNTDSFTVNVVLNTPPTVASDNASVSTIEGTPATNTGTYSDGQGVNTVTLSADIGTVVQNPNGTWSWSAPATEGPAGPTTVTITATDDFEEEDTTTFTFSVNNAAPILNSVNATATVNEDGTVTLSGTYSDPGVSDTHTLTINWGEGAPEVVAVSGGTFSITHKYLDDNPTNTASDSYTVGVTLTDDDGDSATATRSVTVNNVAAVLGAITVVAPETGNVFTVNGSFTDAGKSDTHTVLINWGDGSLNTLATVTESNGVGTFTATHTYSSSTTYTVTATVVDDDTGSVSGTAKAFNFYVGPSIIAVSRFVSSTSSVIDWISPTGAVLWTIPVPSQNLFGVPNVAGVTDRNGDGVADAYIGSQAGLFNRVGLVDGKTGALLWNAAPFASTLKLGVNVAVGDITGDRKPELVVAPSGAASPNVRAFQQTAGSPTFAFSMIRDFFAYTPTFTGGVNVAVGDVNGDGLGDIVTGTASNSDNVRVFSGGVGTSMIADFFAFKRTGVIPGYVGGVSVAAGDVNGDNFADLITSTQTQYSRVRVYSGGVNAGLANTPNTLLQDFFTVSGSNIGVIAMARDLDGDGISEVVTLTHTVGSVLINSYGYNGTLAATTLLTKAYNFKPSAVRLG